MSADAQRGRAQDTPDVLVKNATLWTGDDNGNDVQYGADVLLSRGLVKKIGKGIKAPSAVVHEADGAWLTPGIFDMHSHIGVDSYPALSGASDTNSVQAPILPYLRSLDAINTHDLAYKLTIAGGVTTSLILPGSANNIGGQAFVVKLRNTTERTPDSMVLEMPYNVAEAGVEWPEDEPPRWRHAKHACGENIRSVQRRMPEYLSLSCIEQAGVPPDEARPGLELQVCVRQGATDHGAAGRLLRGRLARV